MAEGRLSRWFTKLTVDRLPLVLILLSLILYLPGFAWGIPHATAADRVHAWGNDDLVPLAPLNEMYQTFVRAAPDRNVAYPWFHYFLVAFACSPYMAYLLITGGLHIGQAAYPFGFTDPVTAFVHLSWLGRAVSLSLVLAAILAIYSSGKFLWGRAEGFAAAVATMLLFPVAYYARIGNIDGPLLGWTCLAIAAGVRWLGDAVTTRQAAWLGILVALAVSTKEQAVGSFVLLVPALVLFHCYVFVRRRRPHEPWSRMLTAPVVAAVAFGVAYVVAQGALVDPARFQQHNAKLVGVGTNAIAIYNRYPATPAGYASHLADIWHHLIDVMGMPALLIAAAGVVRAVRSDRRVLVLLLSAAGMVLLLMPVRLSRIHYLLPAAASLTLFVGYAVGGAMRAGAWSSRAAVILAGLLAVFLSLRSVDLTHDMLHDSRYAAGDWLDREARSGDCVLYFGANLKLPHLRADVCGHAVDVPAKASAAIAENKPAFIIIIPEDTDENRARVEWRQGPHSVYNAYLPQQVYESLVSGALGYRLVGQFQSPRLFPWLHRPFLSFATVNPPVQVFARADRATGYPVLEPWRTAPHYPKVIRVNEPPPVDTPTGGSRVPAP